MSNKMSQKMKDDERYAIGDLDNGIVHIGTTYCLNHEVPKCKKCPNNKLCEGYQKQPELISDYRT